MAREKGREQAKGWRKIHVRVRSRTQRGCALSERGWTGNWGSVRQIVPHIYSIGVKDNIFILVATKILLGSPRYLFFPLKRATNVNQHFQSLKHVPFEKIM